MKVNSGQAPSTLIPEYIGSDFDKIVTVADNLNDIELALENINSVVTVANNILDVNKVATIADDVTLVADNIDYIKNAATGNGGNGGNGGSEGSEGSEGISARWYIGDTPPTQPAAGATWYCTLDGRTYTWYEDDDSGQWVESSPQNGDFVSVEKMTLNSNATDLTTIIELVNQIRAGLIANGLAQ